jgi:ribonuclease-3 family protein
MDNYNGLTLAYIGDAQYELMVRKYLIDQGIRKVDNLHKAAVEFTCAEGQEKAFNIIEQYLTEEETGIFKRGRNSKTDRKARSASISSYRRATGFESLFGYLYIENRKDRLEELFNIIVKEMIPNA